MIASAAIWTENKIYTGRSHPDIKFAWISDGVKLSKEDYVEGFVTDDDIFLNRKEAAEEAFKCGQIKKEKHSLESWMISDLGCQ